MLSTVYHLLFTDSNAVDKSILGMHVSMCISMFIATGLI